MIAREVGVEISLDDFDRIHRRVPVLANAKTTGRYPVEYLWYAGGVPAIMLELGDLLNLDCLTVTGKTLGENLQDIQKTGFFAETRGYLNNVKVQRSEVLRSRDDPFGPEGGVAVLRGNLAPRGAVVKYFSVPDEMHVHTGPARVFDFEDAAVEALLARQILPGDVDRHSLRGPARQRDARDVLRDDDHCRRPGADGDHGDRDRWAVLRRGQGASGRPRDTGGARRRADRARRGGGSDRDPHPRAAAGHCGRGRADARGGAGGAGAGGAAGEVVGAAAAAHERHSVAV